ncbi:hypothetical protein WN51_12725 [Melipona quadrifasciata]|uniref:Uncharacterized protein n=1 Tax=Melipona quadrifasciata TaxID=166423 RepID=A0A0M9A0T9_9HYME|nr:hypothetical protein WN51_12725 [Melipona quadrifasciata]
MGTCGKKLQAAIEKPVPRNVVIHGADKTGGAGGGGREKSHPPSWKGAFYVAAYKVVPVLLITIPACLAQFSIQGPSDGNRVAQGLRIEEGKGIQYTDQNEPDDSGFSITGATDGSAQIQGASDGHSNFQIHGATRGPAERYVQGPTAGSYNIQGSTDGHSQSIIQGSYDTDLGPAKSLQYNDPSGLRVNWRSYDRRPQPTAHQEAQYSETSVANVPRASSRQKSRRPPPPPPEPIQQSKPLETAPSHIQHLLQLQAQLPYVNIVPEPYRYENLIASQGNQQPRYEPQYEPQYEPREEPAPEPRRPNYRGKSRGSPRHRRQTSQYRQGAAPVQRQQPRRLSQPPADPPINYNPNLPPHLQQLLKYQAQTPYINSIPEQYRFNPEPAVQMQLEQVRRHYEDLLRQQPASPTVHTVLPAVAPAPKQIRGPPQDRPSHPRQRRQAAHQPQRQLRPQSLPAEPAPQYSTNIPNSIRSILQFQAQIPYNIIANQVEYKFDKTYVPQSAQPAGPPQVQYQGQSQYQGQRQYREENQYQDQNQYQSQLQSVDEYQGQPTQTHPSQSQYLQYPQYQAQYGAQRAEQGVRPVTENQY